MAQSSNQKAEVIKTVGNLIVCQEQNKRSGQKGIMKAAKSMEKRLEKLTEVAKSTKSIRLISRSQKQLFYTISSQS